MINTVVFGVGIWLKFFFLFTPFFALSMFLTVTRGHTEAQRRKLAIQVVGAVAVLCAVLFFFGNIIFALFDITVDAFRVGAGALLFIAAVTLVQANPSTPPSAPEDDIAVVPLAMPIIVGPATTGALLVLGAEIEQIHLKVVGCMALLLAVIAIGIILCMGALIERVLGKRGLNILSKMTGLVLAALAAQMMLTGVQHFLAADQAGAPGSPAIVDARQLVNHSEVDARTRYSGVVEDAE